MSCFIRLFTCLFTVCVFFQIHSHPSFANAISRYGMSDKPLQLVNARKDATSQFLKLIGHLYDKNINIAPASACKIPPIIHQIWIGKPLPAEYLLLMKTWQEWSDWEYKLWTEAEIDKLPMLNRQLYEQVTNPGEKADIARLEILRLYGGIYVDVDFECLNPLFFNELVRKCTFALGIEPLDCQHGVKFHMGNAFMASVPFHPLIEILVKELEANSTVSHDIVERTGPGYLTRIVLQNFSLLLDSGILLPPTFVYPVYDKKEIDNLSFFIKPETAAIHYWSASWILPHPQQLESVKERCHRKGAESIFSEIYRTGAWAKDEQGNGTSGLGSTLQEGRSFIEFVQAYIDTHAIHSVIDLGCGDWNLAKEIVWGDHAYIGIDVVATVVQKNQKNYGCKNIQFIQRDIILDPLPCGDLLICKDVLMHLSFSDIFSVLRKLSNYKHCILVNEIARTEKTNNVDIVTGDFRCLDLTRPPFNLQNQKIFTYDTGRCLQQILVIEN